MTQAQASRSSKALPGRPRLEAAELSEALGIEDFSYWESQTPTFRGVYQNRVVTVEKRALQRKRFFTRKAWHDAVRRLTKEPSTPREGQRLLFDWVFIGVQRVSSGPSAKPGVEPPRSARQVPLEQAVQEQAPRLLVAEAKTYTEAEKRSLVARAAGRGQQYLLSLIQRGELVPARDIADAWGITAQALGNRKRAGDVFGLMVNNRLWYPAALKHFPSREDAEHVCGRIRHLPPVEQYLVLTNPHAALGERTVAEALAGGMNKDVAQFLDSVAERE